jgi:hypothetical protein
MSGSRPGRLLAVTASLCLGIVLCVLALGWIPYWVTVRNTSSDELNAVGLRLGNDGCRADSSVGPEETFSCLLWKNRSVDASFMVRFAIQGGTERSYRCGYAAAPAKVAIRIGGAADVTGGDRPCYVDSTP